MIRDWPLRSTCRTAAVFIAILTAALAAGCAREPERSQAPAKEEAKKATAPEAPGAPAAGAVKATAAVDLQAAGKASSPSPAGSAIETPPPASPEPKKPVVIPPDLKALPIPADGDRLGVKVEGVAVARIRILRSGAEVLVDTEGFQRVAWDQQFLRQGTLPQGYFNFRKIDANGDGDLRDELSVEPGLWKMDQNGNISRY